MVGERAADTPETIGLEHALAHRTGPVIVWFRRDLRLADNPALTAACRTGRPVICLYVEERAEGLRPAGGASRWWLHHSLAALAGACAERGATLHFCEGDPLALVPRLASLTDAAAVFWNRRYGAVERERDATLKSALSEMGLAVSSSNAHLLFEPWEIKTVSGTPMKVFTPFWKAARALRVIDPPAQAPDRLDGFQLAGPGFPLRDLADLALLPVKPDWAGGLRAEWQPGEAGARTRLDDFLRHGLAGYAEDRNRPDRPASSKLSPHLAFGEISPRQIWHTLTHAIDAGRVTAGPKDVQSFQSEIGWREFSYHLLYHFPELATRNFVTKFDAFPWSAEAAELHAWEKGLTGYPIVDAGMRQLWQTGWMHNRVRMIAASFLIKHLLLDWRIGERWFWDTLCDADPANNAASWQWVAGSGADAAPYFRIFNPILQGLKFDPDGDYVRRFVPELARMPAEHIHAPWEAPRAVLEAAGVRIGTTYPAPIVDHGKARDRALAAFQRL